MIGSLEIGGSQTMILNIYKAIDRNKIQFDFVVHCKEIGVLEEEITHLGGKIFRCPRYKGINHRQYTSWWNNFFASHPEYRIIHGHVRSVAAIYLGVAKRYDRITICHSHSTSNGKNFSSIIKAVMQFPIRYIADYFFACSLEAGEWLFGKKIVKSERFKIIHNCIDISRFSYSKSNREAIRSEFSIDKDEYVIGHVGRFEAVKNHKFLVEIFHEFQKYYPKSKLLLVGDGSLREDIILKVEKLRIRDKVIFAGQRSDVERLYSAMDSFLLPSLWEGMPVVVIEARISGLHCYLSDNISIDKTILIDEINYISLNKTATLWAKELLSSVHTKRGDIDKKLFKKFDSIKNANILQIFYQDNGIKN